MPVRIAFFAAASSSAVGPSFASASSSASIAASSSAGEWPGFAVAVIWNSDPSVSDCCSAVTVWAIFFSYTSDLYSRLALPPPRMRAVIAASASPGLKIGAVIHPMYTRGSSTLSVVVARRSSVIGGVWALTGATSGPRAIVPKYFSTSCLVFAMSMSPTIARLALLGA